MEKLIVTHAIEEAVSYLEAFIAGAKDVQRLWISGDIGSGKSFLAQWALNQSKNGRRGAIFDAPSPAVLSTLLQQPLWVVFSRNKPINTEGIIVEIGPPEYERKVGVLEEWATRRNLQFEPAAMAILLQQASNNLQYLRSLAERTAMQALLTDGVIDEIDVVRTLNDLGLLKEK